MNLPAVARYHPFQLRQRWLRWQPDEDIDALPSSANHDQPRALRNRLQRTRTFPNRPSVRPHTLSRAMVLV